jgi:glutamate-1-semialdehyde 2,1-aminomutase
MIWDLDDNEYIDYAGGMGPLILGHNHPRVLAAVTQAMKSGQCFAGQHELEIDFAERLVDTIPWIESIRIGLSGSEMDLLAIRIAKAVTGRSKILRFTGHYHGWLDPLLVGAGVTTMPIGSPLIGLGQSVAAASEILMCEWNDVSTFPWLYRIGEGTLQKARDVIGN